MPLPARPLLYQCPACGWRQIVAPIGDVLLDEPAACRRCGQHPLSIQPASLFQAALKRLLEFRQS
jgi:uncharacterized protein (DUF934 family)